jgi:DNA-binding LacI/PurR family transcriptional regulator
MSVGLVVPDVAAAFYAAALKAAQEVLETAGYHVLVANTERAPHREREALSTLRAHQVDGIIVATSGGYRQIGVPAVFFDNVPVAADERVIALDNEGGVAMLVDHLARRHGHTRIAYLGPPEAVADGSLHGVGRERLEAFRAAVGRSGLPLPPDYVKMADVACSEAVGTARAGELLELAEPPTAVVAGADTLAIGLLRALRGRSVRVPEEVAVVSFDEPVHGDLIDPPVTALDRHDRELGRRAAEMLLDALRDAGATTPGVVRVPLTLCTRRSCGCPGP